MPKKKRASNNDAPKKSYLKVLAILILIERPARIKSFIDKEVCDDDLPLLMKLPRGNIGPCQFYSRLEGERDGPLECFDKWSGQEKKAFEDHQWRVVARIFKRGEKKLVDHLKFLPHDILPFTFHGKEKRLGGFGHVNKVSIHPSHHNFEACGKFFAVKTLRPHNMISTGNLFRREVAILRRISHDTHTHLISLLATYEHHDCYHLIFSWAEHDLEEYWKRHRSEGKQTLMWLAEQCHGIVGGLEFIQYFPTQSGWSLLQQDPDPETVQRRIQSRGAVTSSGNVIRHLYGRHGDIKPRNILWFADTSRSSPIYGRPRGTLKITDFGFADFSKNCEVDRQSLVYGIVHTHTYRAPEVDFVEELLSPLTDIWSLGCVFLEFITWFFEGWKLIEEFSRKRLDSERTGMTGKCENTASDTFFFTREDKMSKKLVPETKKAVSIHINELKERAKVGGFARDFLVMIENDMEQGWMNQFNSDTDNDD
ncbi:hypothetical protein CGMCC3_g4865 [Colletotrichum fructicola]|nr:uncharacterized protein CGMCC3_g4865 [Colletotrichum fructicola]KAE9579294.1 hypothetical protein CGMCC3_g4865 [Colletotrichum fructicola]